MKIFLFLFLVMICACFGMQLWGYLRYQIEERTKPHHERIKHGAH